MVLFFVAVWRLIADTGVEPIRVAEALDKFED
jgi:hypothetical protein